MLKTTWGPKLLLKRSFRCWWSHIPKNSKAAKTTFFSSKITFSQHDKGCAKFLICIKNSKFKKPRTWTTSKIISEEGHVFQNSKFLKLKEIKNLAHQKTFLNIQRWGYFLSDTLNCSPLIEHYYTISTLYYNYTFMWRFPASIGIYR